jgi:hypothetical protein
LTLTPMPNGSIPATSPPYPSGEISKLTTPNGENLTSSPVPFPAREPVARENGKGYSIPTQPCGGKDSVASLNADPDSSLLNNSHGVVRRGLRAVLGGLRMAGYAYEAEFISAQELGAGHPRPRLFIISYPDQWRPIFEQSPCWSDQMREMVQRERADSPWLSVERPSHGPDDGVSRRLVRLSVPTNHPGRIRSRYLAGRTVTPGQAAIALKRVLYLNSLCHQATSY